MDILLNIDSSLYWQIPLGILLLVLSIFFIWLALKWTPCRGQNDVKISKIFEID